MSNREIEAKFTLTSPALADKWRAGEDFVAGYRLEPNGTSHETDTYYDSSDFCLLRNGFTLRQRTRESALGTTYIVGCKDIDYRTPRGIHNRMEREVVIESPLPSTELSLNALPADIVESLLILDHKSLTVHPVCRLRQARHKHRVMLQENDVLLAELSLDDLDIEIPAPNFGGKHAARDNGRDLGDWRAIASLTVVEIELDDRGDEEALRALAGEAQIREGAASNAYGKLQMALIAAATLTSAFPDEALTRRHTADFCRAIWKQQLVEMIVAEAGVRHSSDIEYVHEMRVATRRARAAFNLYAGFFPKRSKMVRRIARALRQTGRRLGKVRDLDVAIVRLETFAEARRVEAKRSRTDVTLRRRLKRLQTARERAHADLVSWLDSRKYASFVADTLAFCERTVPREDLATRPPHDPPAPVQLRHTLPSMIWSRFEAIRAFEPLFEAAADSPEEGAGYAIPVETLHALRIECKYLRYHLEFASALLGDEADAVVDALKALQEHLGNLNDAVVGNKLALTTQPEQYASTADAWSSHQQAEAEALRHSVPAQFARFVSVENRLVLAQAIASI